MFRCIQGCRSPPVRSLSTRYAVMRFSSEKATERSEKDRWNDVPSDPRPPWVYSTSAGLRLVLVPSVFSVYWWIPVLKHLEGIILYAVFFADFGDREHVFMPVRRCCAAAWQAGSDCILNREATKMATETTGCVLYYNARRKEIS